MGSEDCLFINVFTPRIPSRVDRRPLPSSLIPVMVYIHGGDFISGSGQIDPKPLVQKGVVVVSMNYRLGPLGFLNLQNQYVTGNQGLKDQLMALQWVSQNIHAFGGDNTKVTIFGEGAGGASVHLHLLSPLGEGLYRNGISQSGNALSRMIEGRRRGVTATEAVRYLDHTECNLGGDVEVVECLQGKTVSNLYDNPISVGDEAAEGRKGSAPFRHIPTIDYFADVSFMPQHPYITMKTGNQKDLPFIIGITKHDGGYRLRKVWDELVEEGEDWESYGPHRLLDVPYDKISDYDKLLAQVVRHFYMGPKEMKPDPDNSKALMQMFTDAVYRSPTNKILELLDEERVSHLFSYEITHKPSKSHLQDFEVVARAADDKDEEFAVVHGDDLLFLFDNVKEHLQGAVKTEDDKRTRKALVKMWTNFAKYEDPTPYRNPNMPPWDPYDKTTRAYLAIGPKPKQMTKSHNAAMYFWERMYWQDLDLTFVKNLSRVSPLNKPATTAGLNYIESRANQLKNQLQNSQTQAQNQVAQSRAAVPHQPGQQQRLQDPSALNYYNGLQPISYNSFLLPHNQFQYYKQMTNAQGVQK
jgi:carboxylesterase type B